MSKVSIYIVGIIIGILIITGSLFWELTREETSMIPDPGPGSMAAEVLTVD